MVDQGSNPLIASHGVEETGVDDEDLGGGRDRDNRSGSG